MHSPTAASGTGKIVSLFVLGLGVLLAGMMIYTESEPGALPLALILAGAIGYGVTAWKSRRA